MHFALGCEATSFELESFQFYWKETGEEPAEYEGPYIDSSIDFHSEQYLR